MCFHNRQTLEILTSPKPRLLSFSWRYLVLVAWIFCIMADSTPPPRINLVFFAIRTSVYFLVFSHAGTITGFFFPILTFIWLNPFPNSADTLSLFPDFLEAWYKKVAKAMHIFTVVDMLIQKALVVSRSNHDKKLRHVSWRFWRTFFTAWENS